VKTKLLMMMLVLLCLPYSVSYAEKEKSVQLASLGRFSAGSTAPLLQVSFALRQLDQRLLLQPSDHEASLIKALVKYRSGDYASAMQTLDALIKRAPDFNLAYLVKGDLLLSRVRHISALGQNEVLTSMLAKRDVEPLMNLRAEARMRFKGVSLNVNDGRMPRQILALGDKVRSAILVDKSSHRLYVYQRRQNGDLSLLHDYYVSTGKLTGNKKSSGDLRTPEGVYFVTSWIPEEKLPDKYGVGAFPVNYPNELDQRLGKTGHGIWLHGTQSRYYSRPPLDSEGCVVLTNSDFNQLRTTVTPGITPVVIAAQVDWVDAERWQQQRAELLAALESWRHDWQSLDIERYLAHYAGEFWSRGYNINSWKKRKRNVFRAKTYQSVRLSDISLFTYSQGSQAKEGEIAVVRFYQSYHSNNFNSDMSKRLYLKRHAGRWKIVYEGS